MMRVELRGPQDDWTARVDQPNLPSALLGEAVSWLLLAISLRRENPKVPNNKNEQPGACDEDLWHVLCNLLDIGLLADNGKVWRLQNQEGSRKEYGRESQIEGGGKKASGENAKGL
jgi:hypothetical protein